MSYTSFVVEAGSSRIHQTLSLMMVHFSIGVAAIRHDQNAPPLKGKQGVRSLAAAADRDVLFYIDGYRECFTQNHPLPAAIPITITPRQNMAMPLLEGTGEINSVMSGALFAFFAETAVDWVKANVTTDYANFPPVANFARVIRNAVSHSGVISMSSPRAVPVKWRNFSISNMDDGRAIIGTSDFSIGDFYMLLFDLDQELDALDAPLLL